MQLNANARIADKGGKILRVPRVRSQTPKLEGKPKRSAIPKVRNKRTYEKRFTLKRKPGQNWMRQ